jgi:hypothetical protein
MGSSLVSEQRPTADDVAAGRSPGHTDEPDKFFFITQLREAVGLPVGALPITPKQAWEEAIAVVRRLAGTREIDRGF